MDYNLTGEIWDDPSLTVCINREWLPVLTGILEPLTLSDYWITDWAEVGPDAIEKLIARLNESDFVLGCGPTMEPNPEGVSWCYRFDFIGGDNGGFTAYSFDCSSARYGGQTLFAEGMGYYGPLYDPHLTCGVPGDGYSTSIAIIDITFLDAFHITQCVVEYTTPSNYQYGGSGLTLNGGGYDLPASGGGNKTATFDVDIANLTYIKVDIELGKYLPTELDSVVKIRSITLRGPGTNPLGATNCV